MQAQITKCIIRIMKTHGITQAHLATALNCSQTAISHILAGKTRLTIDDLAKIASTLRVSIEELIAEATLQERISIDLSQEAENYICGSSLAFFLFNKIKKPIPERELLEEFPHHLRKEVLEHINQFRTFGLLVQDIAGNIKLVFPDPSILQYRLTKKYTDRIAEIYSALRPMVLDVATTPAKIPTWKERNYDAFYFEYFTEDQIRQQNAALRQTVDLIKHHIRMNRHEPNTGLKDNTELRVVFVSTAPCPQMFEEKNA
jgi:transcriptional regulator with XRE-family HTH domain